MQTHEVSKRIADLPPEKRALLRRRLQDQQPAEVSSSATLPTLTPDPEHRHEPFPLTDIQQAYWAGRSGFFDLGVPGTNFYQEFELSWEHDSSLDRINMSAQRVIRRVARRSGILDLDAYKTNILLNRLDMALERVIARHDMLRAVMLPDGRQHILPQAPHYTIKVVDLRGKDPRVVEATLEEVRERMRATKGTIDRWPLFDLLVHRLDYERLRVHLRLDTLLIDGISRAMLIQDLLRHLGNARPPVPECSYRDYAVTWTAFQENELYQRDRAYWLRRLPSLPPAPDLPLARPLSPRTDSSFVNHNLTLLDPESWQRFKTRAARAELTPTGAVVAAFVDVLAAWSASPRFSLSLEGTYRPPIHPQIGEIIGNFNTIYLLAVDLAPGTFETRARRLQQQMMTDLEHRYFSGFQVLRELNRLHGGSGRAAMPVVFNSVLEYSHPSYQGGDRSRGARAMLSYESIHASLHIPQVLLLPTHSESGDGALVCNWQAAERVFPPGMETDMLDAYNALLHRLADSEEAWQETTRSLTPAAQLEQRAALNATDAPIPSGLLHTLFMAQAYQHLHDTAVLAPDQTLTYAELARRATQVSRWLHDLGVRPGALVAVVMELGWEQIVAVLGALQAGAAFLPLAPDCPPEQLRATLAHAEVTLALTQSWLVEPLAWPEQIQLLGVDTLQSEGVSEHALEPLQSPDDPAYVIYTSGCGGPPKGATISHRAAINTILDVNRRFGVGPDDRLLALSPLGCDLAIYDLFGALLAGGTLVIPAASARRDPEQWAELIAHEQITIWNTPPALLDLLVVYAAERPDMFPRSLRLALLSRDRVPLSLAERLRAVAPNAVVVSLSGATEAAIWSALHPVAALNPDWSSIPYGRPMANQRVHVLNEALEPCPVWVPGQLCIGGAGVAMGYWRDTAQSRASFIIHPRSGERLYRTGELGRFLPDGTIELLGRVGEFPIVIHGYRIDPRQIEAALERHPTVRAAIVLARTDAHDSTALVAYLLPAHGTAPAIGELRGVLRAALPDYMMPATFVVLDSWPLTADGRVDRHALPAPVPDAAPPPHVHVAPRDALELHLRQIWEELLPARPIGVTDNFFELGGNSFTAVRLLTRMQEVFGRDLVMATFLQDATIEHLCTILRERTTEQLAQRLRQHAAAEPPPPVRVPSALTPSTPAPPAASTISANAPPAPPAPVIPERPPAPPVLPEGSVPVNGMLIFMLIWAGQLVSTLGSGMTGFALSIWVFDQTRSATQLALIAFFAMLPMILVSPVAGALVDRWDRRRVMVVSNIGASLGTIGFIILFGTGLLQVWHIYVLVSIASVFNAFQFPAFAASTTLLVPQQQLGRASGLVQLGQGIGQLVSPVLAGLLVGVIGVQGVIGIDFVTFLFAIAALLVVHIPRPRISAEGRAARGSLAQESTYGWTYIRARPGLLGLLLFFTISNFMMGTVIVLSTPLLLSFTDPATLGTVLSVSGFGIVVGGIVMSVWGGPRRRVYGVLGGALLSGVSILVAGLAPSALLIGVAAFFFTMSMPITVSSSQAIWQRKVALDVQGRVFAIRSMIATAAMPIAYLVSGPLADFVFNPLLAPGGALAGSLGRIIGVGPGRGIGLMFIVLGLLTILTTIIGSTYPRLRRVEDELPDAINMTAPTAVAAQDRPAVPA